ncbi:hypothetical protein SNE40_017152 [Patella caerulea]|uniref:Cellulase n=1 Tax=Patella caerulea TaxID=87958 RepID=A0AAN8JG89_PATCE
MIRLLILFAVFTASCYGNSKCTMQNGVRVHNNKRCASTTHYYDSHKGACGCGHGDTQFSWNHDHLVVAASQNLFDPSGSAKDWCGGSCGKCVRLTPTGGFVQGRGTAPKSLTPHTFMITNLCPPWAPNQDWCAQKGTPGQHVQPNKYGYEVHFDLENGASQVSRLGWDNPEVTWEFVSCNGQNTPAVNLWHQCECSH